MAEVAKDEWPRELLHTQPVLGAEGVRAVLTGLRSGTIGPEAAERWAGFMRWGEFGRWLPASAGASRRARVPLHIEYSGPFEEEIVEVLAALDESGEDGALSTGQIDDFLAKL